MLDWQPDVLLMDETMSQSLVTEFFIVGDNCSWLRYRWLHCVTIVYPKYCPFTNRDGSHEETQSRKLLIAVSSRIHALINANFHDDPF